MCYLCLRTLWPGCANSPLQIAMMNDKQIQTVPTNALINAYIFGTDDLSIGKPENVERELRRRGEFTEDEWSLIKQKRVVVGMREKAMLMAMGRIGSPNTTVTASGVEKQWVFGPQPYSIYVYTSNGIVTAIQN